MLRKMKNEKKMAKKRKPLVKWDNNGPNFPLQQFLKCDWPVLFKNSGNCIQA
jgi:hypothetical protein